jgi:glycosyltransferase involved in cell wall biosynthesis
MKTIAVNTRLLLPGKLEGLGRFTDETLKRITKDHPEIHFLFLFDRPFNPSFIYSENITPVQIFPPARHPLLFYWWFEWSLPTILSKYKVDLFLSPDGYLSLNSDVPQLPVIHDLNFEHNPQDIIWYNSIHFRHFFPKYAQKARRIATVSEFSAKDIADRYSIDPQKIDIVYNGVSSNFKPVPEEIKEETRQKISNGKPYFLYWGAIHPRKNISNLIKAFDLFKHKHSNPFHLVIAGEKSFWTSEMEESYSSSPFKDCIHFPGRIPESELNNLIGSAFAVTYTTLFEGFGLPIIEAFSCETPVITSNVTAMPEIAGDGALMVDPFSINSIASAMEELFLEPKIYHSLIIKGKKRVELFTWEKTSKLLWDSIEKVRKF